MKFILSIPPSINQTYGVSRTGNFALYKKTKVKDWEEEAGWEIINQWKENRGKALLGNVKLVIAWYYAVNRDIDSGIKVLLDLLQKQRVYLNDSQVVEVKLLKYEDKEEPRVEVEVIEK